MKNDLIHDEESWAFFVLTGKISGYSMVKLYHIGSHQLSLAQSFFFRFTQKGVFHTAFDSTCPQNWLNECTLLRSETWSEK